MYISFQPMKFTAFFSSLCQAQRNIHKVPIIGGWLETEWNEKPAQHLLYMTGKWAKNLWNLPFVVM